ncbi:lamin tail domain-containing protein [Patescibacteria group bacterium]|nr:lamin tail domain-containing protein [Patescibacteria group bacterium]
MNKKIILILAVTVFFFGFRLVSAEVIINEVQIAGSTVNDEFIELYNSSGSSVDLTGFYIKKKTSSGNESNFVVSSRFEGLSISGGDYLLLARENNYTGTVSPDILWPSSYSLASNNSLILYRGGETDADEVAWQEIEEGKSTQKTSSGWVVALPTPRAQNSNSGDSGSGEEESDDVDDEDSSSESGTEYEETAPTLKTKILTKTLAFVGQPVEFSLDVKYGDLTYATGKYFWNFGDGDSKEIINQSGGIYHTYFYPGEYVISSEYYRSHSSRIPDTISKFTIKVMPLTVSISKVGDAKDFFVELTNNSAYEMDISYWKLATNIKTFIFPKNTLIAPKKQMTISSKITGFVLGDEKNLKLISSAGDVVSVYGVPVIPIEASVRTSSQVSLKTSMTVDKIENQEEVEDKIQENSQISGDDLSASVSNSDIGDDDSSSSYLFFGGLALFLIILCGAVYFLRKNSLSISTTEGDDFEIIDE